jgi:hypothetical protein
VSVTAVRHWRGLRSCLSLPPAFCLIICSTTVTQSSVSECGTTAQGF